MILLLALQFATGIIVSPAGTFLPVYLSDLGYQAVFIAGAFTLQRVMGLVSSLAGGTLSDLLGRKRTLLLGQAGFFAASLVFLARSPASILPLWALYGVGTTLNSLGSQGYLMDTAKLRSLGVMTALYYWGSTLGGSIGNPVAGLLIRRVSYPGLSVVFAAVGLGTMALTAVALPRPSGRNAGQGGRTGAGGKSLFGFVEIARRPAVFLLAMLRFLPTFCYGMVTVFVPLLLKRDGAATSTIALYATVSSLSAALAQLLVGRLTDRVGPKGPAIVVYLVFAASALGLGLAADRVWAVVLFAVLAMSGAWSLSVIVQPMVALASEASERGRVLGFVHLFWNLAMILGSLVGGFLFQASGGLPFIVGGAAVAAAPVLVLVFFRRLAARGQG
jgi:MFS family permease